MKTSLFKFVLSFFVLSLISVSEVFPANNIAIMVVETNIDLSLKNNHAAIWESGLMDVFFGEGYIVTNALPLRIAENDREDFPPDAISSFQEAIENGTDYFVLTTLNYESAQDKKISPNIATISVKLFRITPYKFMFEKKMSMDSFVGKILPQHELDAAQQAAKTLLPYLGNGVLSYGAGNE